MSAPSSDGELERVRRERDLYSRLLSLGAQRELETLLAEALGLVVELTGAKRGYLELRGDPDAEDERWSLANGFSVDEIEQVRSAISQGIIGQALASGETIVTASAVLDPRFRERASVQASGIEAVLCVPIGEDPAAGILYLQGGKDRGAFSKDDQHAAELFARHLAPVADRLLEQRRRREEADPTAPFRRTLRVNDIVGRSAALAAALRQAALVAPLDVSVLLTGETGTGKSQLARAIHDSSPRRAAPYVEVNCAALPDTLVESELFGALPGAHSGAVRRMDGKVAAAEGGTLVLDEIAELSPATQAKLLQLLQSRQYFPLGGSKPVVANVRVIAATNVDLEAAVAARRFREDLFYRLHVLPIRMPSLAERREDVAPLAVRLCANAVERHKLAPLQLSRGAVRALQACEWPGNVRQLEHAVEVAAIRAAGEGASQVERVHCFPESTSGSNPQEAVTLQELTRRFQARVVRETLEAHNWNVVEAARQLDVGRSQLYKLIHAFGLERTKR